MRMLSLFFVLGPASLGVAAACSAETFTAADVESDASVEAGSEGETSVETGDDVQVVRPNEAAAPDGSDGAAHAGPDTSTPIVPVEAGFCTETPDPVKGAFVSPSGAGNKGPCDPNAPCGSIQDGIAWAKSNARTLVYVDQGTYTELLALAAGLTIQGGWKHDQSGWKRICDDQQRAQSVVVQASGSNITARADNIGGTVTLDTINLRSRLSPPAAPGESFFGLFATGATTRVNLVGVGISVNAGGDGSTGSAGNYGSTGGSGCAAGTPTTPPPAAAGAGAQLGSFSITGYATAQGAAGASGSAGGNGTFTAGTCSATNGCKVCTLVDEGQPGTLLCEETRTETICGSAGVPGCGGGGGTPGAAGTSGGSSVALYVWGATVTTDYANLTAGNGGAGGAGGAGGSGGPPSPGTNGAARFCKTACTGINVCNATGVSEPGGTGNPGATGGTGGTGGGGAGGSSYAYFLSPGLGSVTTSNTIFYHGNAGGPGVGGAPTAASGVVADHN